MGDLSCLVSSVQYLNKKQFHARTRRDKTFQRLYLYLVHYGRTPQQLFAEFRIQQWLGNQLSTLHGKRWLKEYLEHRKDTLTEVLQRVCPVQELHPLLFLYMLPLEKESVPTLLSKEIDDLPLVFNRVFFNLDHCLSELQSEPELKLLSWKWNLRWMRLSQGNKLELILYFGKEGQTDSYHEMHVQYIPFQNLLEICAWLFLQSLHCDAKS